MRIGCFLPSYAASSTLSAESVLSFATQAEERGFAHLWAGDHFLWKVGILSPMTTLAAVAAVTQRVRLGTGVYLLNLRHPSITAKDVASVDVLSHGRFILGVGIGGDDPREYEVMGMVPDKKGRQLEENLQAVTSLLAQEGEAFDGELVTVPAFRMDPPAVQRPVPTWIGGRAQVVVERAARMAQGWFPVWVSPARISESWETIESIRGSRDGFDVALNVFTTISNSRESAQQRMAQHLDAAYGLSFDTFERYAAYGTADDIIQTLQPYIDAGITDIVMNIAGPGIHDQLHELADDVLPHLV